MCDQNSVSVSVTETCLKCCRPILTLDWIPTAASAYFYHSSMVGFTSWKTVPNILIMLFTHTPSLCIKLLLVLRKSCVMLNWCCRPILTLDWIPTAARAYFYHRSLVRFLDCNTNPKLSHSALEVVCDRNSVMVSGTETIGANFFFPKLKL